MMQRETTDKKEKTENINLLKGKDYVEDITKDELFDKYTSIPFSRLRKLMLSLIEGETKRLRTIWRPVRAKEIEEYGNEKEFENENEGKIKRVNGRLYWLAPERIITINEMRRLTEFLRIYLVKKEERKILVKIVRTTTIFHKRIRHNRAELKAMIDYWEGRGYELYEIVMTMRRKKYYTEEDYNAFRYNCKIATQFLSKRFGMVRLGIFIHPFSSTEPHLYLHAHMIFAIPTKIMRGKWKAKIKIEYWKHLKRKRKKKLKELGWAMSYLHVGDKIRNPKYFYEYGKEAPKIWFLEKDGRYYIGLEPKKKKKNVKKKKVRIFTLEQWFKFFTIGFLYRKMLTRLYVKHEKVKGWELYRIERFDVKYLNERLEDLLLHKESWEKFFNKLKERGDILTPQGALSHYCRERGIITLSKLMELRPDGIYVRNPEFSWREHRWEVGEVKDFIEYGWEIEEVHWIDEDGEEKWLDTEYYDDALRFWERVLNRNGIGIVIKEVEEKEEWIEVGIRYYEEGEKTEGWVVIVKRDVIEVYTEEEWIEKKGWGEVLLRMNWDLYVKIRREVEDEYAEKLGISKEIFKYTKSYKKVMGEIEKEVERRYREVVKNA